MDFSCCEGSQGLDAPPEVKTAGGEAGSTHAAGHERLRSKDQNAKGY